MSMKSIAWNKLHEACLFLDGIASNAATSDDAIAMIKSGRDFFESDNARLRALIKSAEFAACKCGSDVEPSGCPWCLADVMTEESRKHDDCPAFESNGDVK